MPRKPRLIKCFQNRDTYSICYRVNFIKGSRKGKVFNYWEMVPYEGDWSQDKHDGKGIMKNATGVAIII